MGINLSQQSETKRETLKVKRRGTGMLVASLVIIFLAAGSAGGMWYFNNSVLQEIQNTEASINQIKTDLQNEDADRVKDMAVRIDGVTKEFEKNRRAEQTLANMQSAIVPSIVLSLYSYINEEPANNVPQYRVEIEGTTTEFEAIAQQALRFKQMEDVERVNVTEIGRNQDGEIVFSMEALLQQ